MEQTGGFRPRLLLRVRPPLAVLLWRRRGHGGAEDQGGDIPALLRRAGEELFAPGKVPAYRLLQRLVHEKSCVSIIEIALEVTF